MKTKYLLFALPLVALCACNKESVETNENIKVATITVTSNPETKTVLTESGTSVYQMTWESTDDLKVSYIPAELDTPNPGPTGTFVADSYKFLNTSAAGTTAIFSSSDFPSTGFETGKIYVAVYPWNDTYNRFNVHVPVGETTVTNASSNIVIAADQTYNPANNLGLTNGVIPMVGVIKEGTFSHENVHFQSVCAVLKLEVNNKTGSAKTIGKITVETDTENERDGLAGWYVCDVYFDNPNIIFFFFFYKANILAAAGHPSKIVTLDCGNTTIANGETKVFSVAIAGGGKSIGTITWKVYDNNENVIGATSITRDNYLERGIVYRKTCDLN